MINETMKMLNFGPSVIIGDPCYIYTYNQNTQEVKTKPGNWIMPEPREEDYMEKCDKCKKEWNIEDIDGNGLCPDCRPFGYCCKCGADVREAGFHWDNYKLCEGCFLDTYCQQCLREAEDGYCPDCLSTARINS